MATKLQIRRDTSTNWGSTNPVIAQGELIFVTDLNKLKCGDGTTAYSSLAYIDIDVADVNTLQTLLDGKQVRHGFPNKTDSTRSFVDATRTFTISGTNFPVFNQGIKLLKNTESIVIPNTIGLHFVYYNASNVISTSMTSWTIGVDMPIAIIFWNGSEGLPGEERHGLFDPQMHKYAHNAFRTVYANGLGGTFTNTTFEISSGLLFDEDNEIDIPTTTQARIFYRNGVNYTFTAKQTNYNQVAGSMQYDNNGTLTAVPSNSYMAVWAYGTNFDDNEIIFILGQRTDLTIANARANNLPGNLILTGLPLPELKLLYCVLVRNDATPYEEVIDYRSSQVSGSTVIVTDHQTLTNRSAGDSHPISAITDLQATLDAKATKAASILNTTGVSLDFTGYDRINTTFSSNSAMTITGINSGETKIALIKNTHSTNQYGITLPSTHGGNNTIKDLDSAYIPPGKYVRFYFSHNGTELEITFGGTLSA